MSMGRVVTSIPGRSPETPVANQPEITRLSLAVRICGSLLPFRLGRDKGTLSVAQAASVDPRSGAVTGRGAGENPVGPAHLDRRQFFTLILIAPLLRVYRARKTLTFAEMFAITLRRYAPKLRENLNSFSPIFKRLKEMR